MKQPSDYQHFHNVVRLAEAMFYGAIEHFRKLGLTYVDVPAIVGVTGACENIDTLFKVGNRLNLPLFFTQTGQLALEQILQNAHGVYTVIHSGRDEEKEDDRHLRQFRLTEEEFDCEVAGMTREAYDEEKMYETLLLHLEKATKTMISSALTAGKETLRDVYRRDTGALKEILLRPYLRISYDEALNLLRREGFSELEFGDDFEAEHEARIVESVNKRAKGYGKTRDEWSPVIIMRYPKEIKFFNMKVAQSDPRVVLSADCLLPYAGEAAGAAVREHDGVKLIVRLLTSVMYRLHEQRGGTYEDFRWYTEDMILAKKTLPHAGYGIGNERIMQFLLGLADIRQCSIFSLMNYETHDWDSLRRGQLSMIEHRKTVLLSIGKEENKKRLLPFIKKIGRAGHIFYATDHTQTFLAHFGVPTTKVYKISEPGKPNLKDLLQKDMFDLIVNIPTNPKRSLDEFSDGKFIRQSAIETGTTIITDPDIAESLLMRLAKRE